MFALRWTASPRQLMRLTSGNNSCLHVAAFEGEEVCSSLLMQNLPRKVDYATLHKHFSQFGNVQHFRLVQPERSPIIGYLTYKKTEEAIRALEAHDTKPFSFLSPTGAGNRVLSLTFAPKQRHSSPLYKEKIRSLSHSHFADKPQLPSRTLYVGNLDFKCSPQNITEYFSFWGTVEKVNVVKDKLGQNSGVAFVRFSTQDEASSCWRHPRRLLRKRKLVVEFEKPRGKRLETFERLLENRNLEQREEGRAQSLIDLPFPEEPVEDWETPFEESAGLPS